MHFKLIKGVGLDPNGERLDELTPFVNNTHGGGRGNDYLNFLLNDLKPYIDQRFRTKPGRDFTGIMGSSLGGQFSFYAGLKYQNVFSKIGIFSPSFWFSYELYTFALSKSQEYDNLKLYFMCGGSEYESMAPNMNDMVDKLRSRGFNKIKSLVQPDGNHQEWLWRREFPAAYEYLFL